MLRVSRVCRVFRVSAAGEAETRLSAHVVVAAPRVEFQPIETQRRRVLCITVGRVNQHIAIGIATERSVTTRPKDSLVVVRVARPCRRARNPPLRTEPVLVEIEIHLDSQAVSVAGHCFHVGEACFVDEEVA